MLKKLLATLVAVIMIAAIVAGCASGSPSNTSTASQSAAAASTATAAVTTQMPSLTADFEKVTFMYYGDESKRMKELLPTINEKLKKDLNTELDLIYLPWSECQGGKSELMNASGEEFATYTDTSTTARNVAKNMYTDLTPYCNDKYIPDLMKNVQPSAFQAYIINGKNYALPIGNKPNASENFSVCIRQDLMDEAGVTDVTSVSDLESLWSKVKAKHPDYVGTKDALFLRDYLSYSVSGKAMEFIGKNQYVFTDAVAKDDKVYSYFESDEFKKTCEITERWKQLGIIAPYTLSNPTQGDADWSAGKMLFIMGTAARPQEAIGDLKKAVPNAKLGLYFLGRTTPKVELQPYSTGYYVSISTKNPDRYCMVINWMQKSQEICDLLTYGVEGTDYTLDSNGRVSNINKDPLLDGWMLSNVNFMRFTSDVSDEYIQSYKKWDDDSIPAKEIGFAFNAESVKTELAQMDAVKSEMLTPMEYGFVNYAGNYDNAIKQLKDAGLDKVVAEYQNQFSAWYAAKK